MSRIVYPRLGADEILYLTELDTRYLPGYTFSAQLCKFPTEILYEIENCIKECLQDSPKPSLAVGDFVYVVHEDIHCRAEVIETDELECWVDLVDFGILKSFPNSQIFPLQDACCSKWERVSIHVLLTRDGKFKTGAEAKLKITSSMCIGNLKYFLGELDDFTTDIDDCPAQLVPKYDLATSVPRGAVKLEQPEVGETAHGFVAFAQPGSELYALQLSTFDVQGFERSINSVYNNSDNLRPLLQPQRGQYAVTTYGDQFCRVLVIEVAEGLATVLHTDYGSTDWVDVSNLYELTAGFVSEKPWMAINCLSTVELMIQNEYTLKIISKILDELGTPSYNVEICPHEGVPAQAANIRLKDALPPLVIEHGENTLYLVDVEGMRLAAQLGQYSADQLTDMNQRLTEHIEQGKSQEAKRATFVPGELVALKVDDSFYRGFVSKVDDSAFSVYQVDFGLTSTASLTDLQPLPEEFVQYPQIGCCCLLSEGQLPDPAQEAFFVRNLRKTHQEDGVDIYEFDTAEKQQQSSADVIASSTHHRPMEQCQTNVDYCNDLTVQSNCSPTEISLNSKNSSNASRFSISEKPPLSLAELNIDSRTCNSDNVTPSEVLLDVVQPKASDDLHTKQTGVQFATAVSYPEFGSEPEQVFISEVSGNKVGIQFTRFDVDVLQQISNKLNVFMKSNPDLQPVPVNVGDLVICSDEKSVFFRAEVLRVDEARSDVIFIDYGYTLQYSNRLIRLPKESEADVRIGAVVDKTFEATAGDEISLILRVDGNKLLAQEVESVTLATENRTAATAAPAATVATVAPAATAATVAPAATVADDNDVEVRAEAFIPQADVLVVTATGAAKSAKIMAAVTQQKNADPVAFYAEKNDIFPTGKYVTDDAADLDCGDSVHSSFSLNSDSLEACSKTTVYRGEVDDACPEMSFDVVVTSIHRPTKVCVVKRRWLKAAKSIGESLTIRARSGLQPVVPAELEMGSVVAAKLTTEPAQYHRVRITHYDHETELYKAFLVDSGVVVRLPVANLYRLPADMILSKQAGFAMILKLLADDLKFDRKVVRDIYSGVLQCSVTYANADDVIPGEKSYQASLQNAMGDVMKQLHMEGLVTVWTPCFPTNPVLVPCCSQTAFLDAKLVSVHRVPDMIQMNATLIVPELQERVQRVVIPKDKLKPLYALNPGMPAVALFDNEPYAWQRARVSGRPQPGTYRLYLVDMGIEIMHPVVKTFKCPSNLLHIPEAAVEVTIEGTSQQKIPPNVENRLVVIKAQWSIDHGTQSPFVKVYDHDGNLLFD